MKWLRYKSSEHVAFLDFSVDGPCTFHAQSSSCLMLASGCKEKKKKKKRGLNLQPESLSRTINRFGQREKGTCLSPECEVSAFD